MKYYSDKISYGETFEERVGEPEKFDASLGKIIEGFSFLEQSLSNIIILILGVSNNIGDIVTTELSYKNKINLLSSLFKYNLNIYKKVKPVIDEQFKELISNCYKAEELRNQILHSSYVVNRFRVKKTAKAKKGLVKNIEVVSPDYLLDIAEFIFTVGMDVEEFPMDLDIADLIEGSGKYLTYSKGNKTIMKFEYL